MLRKLLRLFLIDDDQDDRDLFMQAVKEVDEKIGCMAVKDPEEGLIYLSDENNYVPTHIFLDLRLPKLSGRQCLSVIRSIDRLNDVPVIIYTTSNDSQEERDLLQLGATHFTTKPVNPEEIYYIVSMIVNENW